MSAPVISLPTVPRPNSARAATAARVFWLALPVWVQQFLVLAVGLSDRYLAGHVAADTAADQIAYQSAQTTANYLAWFISSYTVLVSVGATALVARCVGAADRDGANRATHQALTLAVLVGLLGGWLGWSGRAALVAGVQLEGSAARFAAEYLGPMFILLPFLVFESAAIACLVGAGDTRTGLFIQAGVVVVNLALSWALAHGLAGFPRLGFVGISWGTAIAYMLGGFTVVGVLAHGRAGLKVTLAGFWPDFAMFGRLLRVSVPAALDSLSTVAGQFWFLAIVNGLGVVASSAHGIALGWEAMAFQSAHAFGVAAMALVGQGLGARRPDSAERAGWTAYLLGCGVTCVMGAIFFTFAPAMFAVFCPRPDQAPVVDAGVPVLRLVALASPALAATIIFTAALRGAGDTRVPVLFTWFGFLAVRIPLALVLTRPEFGLGLYGAWLAMAADLYVRGIFLGRRFAGGRWKSVVV